MRAEATPELCQAQSVSGLKKFVCRRLGWFRHQHYARKNLACPGTSPVPRPPDVSASISTPYRDRRRASTSRGCE
jgi:hypothetical protein